MRSRAFSEPGKNNPEIIYLIPCSRYDVFKEFRGNWTAADYDTLRQAAAIAAAKITYLFFIKSSVLIICPVFLYGKRFSDYHLFNHNPSTPHQPRPSRMISYAAGTTGKHECGDPLGQVKDGVETG